MVNDQKLTGSGRTLMMLLPLKSEIRCLFGLARLYLIVSASHECRPYSHIHGCSLSFVSPVCSPLPSCPKRPTPISAPRSKLSHLWSGGFGGSQFKTGSKGKNKKGSKNKSSNSSSFGKKMNPRDAKRANEQLLKRYGGDISVGTQERIKYSLDSLDPLLKEAANLYKEVTQFDALIAPMTPADRNRLIPPVQFQIAQEERKKLNSLLEENSFSERDLHNIYQRITWDASADAKATHADISGNQMKANLQGRITKACSIAVSAAVMDGAMGKVLDVGCGHGGLVRSLVDAGLNEPDMYVGIDLSPEMIKNAIERYGTARNGRTGKGRLFIADDFLAHDFSMQMDSSKVKEENGFFDSIIFCSSLHDLPDMAGSISKASSLLRSQGGKLIVIHAQGASHVIKQNQANPVMVRRGLPTKSEWKDMLTKYPEWELALEHEPADPRSDRELKEGYLAVLSKK